MKLPVIWLVDIDGTLALNEHRNPYDWRKATQDSPNSPVVTVVQALAAHPAVSSVIALSGRHERARKITLQWLEHHSVPCARLIMRADGDFRPDHVVKEELFRTEIEPSYEVAGVIDDREQVVKMWRRLGLVCLQVADGRF